MPEPLPIHDARSVPDGAVLDYDVCIVGSSVAGATSALTLAGRGMRVAVLEGGGATLDDATSELHDLESSDGLVGLDSRERSLGGTSNAWTGGKTTLDDIDLASRAWVPGSGWPISPDRFRSLYSDAAELLDRPTPDTYDPPHRNDDGFTFDAGDLHTVAFHNDREPLRFGDLLRTRLGPADGVDLYLLANVTDVLLDPDGLRAAGVAVASLGGRRFELRAPVVILACGAIENARLLLASNARHPAGIGNGHDQVGRYYQDHPKGFTAEIAVDPSALTLPASPYWGRAVEGGQERWGVALSSDAQERYETLNTYVRLEPVIHDEVPAGVAALRRAVRSRFRGVEPAELAQLSSEAGDLARIARFRRSNRGPIDRIKVRSFLEQEPRPASRVRLGCRRDRFGSLLPVVDWNLSDLDRRSVRVLHDILAADVVERGLGRLTADLGDDSAVWDGMIDAAHHAGTTRMGVDPSSSVTDPDGQVHGVAGLFVSGASLFPTSGYANPVFTIAALAIHVANAATASITARSTPALAAGSDVDGLAARLRPTSAGLDETRRWIDARRRSKRLTLPVSRGTGVVWTSRGVAELLPHEVEEPGQGQVMVLVEASAVSPGTERADWLARPGANARLPLRPGYSASGTVLRCGPGVYDLEPGARVAVWGPPHRSLVTVQRRQVHHLPDHVDLEEASLVTLGAIAALGVAQAERAGGDPTGRRVAVIGSGPVGLLAQRLAVADGAIEPVVVAASAAKSQVAAEGGLVQLCTPADVDAIGAEIVIEATGEVDGLELAVRAACNGATVVLLGTTRADTVPLPLDIMARNRLRLVGAQMGILDRGAAGQLDRRGAAERYLRHWIDGAVAVSDLITGLIDPRQAASFYEQLAVDRSLVVPLLQWWRLPDSMRATPGSLAVPNPFRRGQRPVVSSVNELATERDMAERVVDPYPAASPIPASGESNRTVRELVQAVSALVAEQGTQGALRVEGSGELAEALRAEFVDCEGDSVEAPEIVIDTEATASSIERLLEGLGPNDSLIVAGGTGTVAIDVQRLVHRTGVKVLAV